MEQGQTLRLGRALFRLRSFTPVPVLAGLFLFLACSRRTFGPGGEAVDSALNLVGLALALAGQALRFYTLGLVPEGTSGQGNALTATQLNTQGPYAYVRNPLYVGNLGICLGLALIAHDPWVYLLGLGFFFGEYFFIIRAEEEFLGKQFPQAFPEYTTKVPRWIPRLTPAYSGQLRESFDWHRALKKEHNPFAAWASGAAALWAWETWARGGLTHQGALLLGGVEALVLAAFLGVKAWKHRWF